MSFLIDSGEAGCPPKAATPSSVERAVARAFAPKGRRATAPAQKTMDGIADRRLGLVRVTRASGPGASASARLRGIRLD